MLSSFSAGACDSTVAALMDIARRFSGSLAWMGRLDVWLSAQCRTGNQWLEVRVASASGLL